MFFLHKVWKGLSIPRRASFVSCACWLLVAIVNPAAARFALGGKRKPTPPDDSTIEEEEEDVIPVARVVGEEEEEEEESKEAAEEEDEEEEEDTSSTASSPGAQRGISLGHEGCERLVAALRGLRSRSTSDLTLLGGGAVFHCHRCILQASSPALNELVKRAARDAESTQAAQTELYRAMLEAASPALGQRVRGGITPLPTTNEGSDDEEEEEEEQEQMDAVEDEGTGVGKLVVRVGEELNPEVLSKVLDYIYGGLVALTESNVEELLELASRLKVARLVEECCAFVARRTSPSRSCEALALAHRNRCTILRRDVLLCVLRHFPRAAGINYKEEEALLRMVHTTTTTTVTTVTTTSSTFYQQKVQEGLVVMLDPRRKSVSRQKSRLLLQRASELQERRQEEEAERVAAAAARGFASLPLSLVEEILQDDRLNVEDEALVFLAATRWIEVNNRDDADLVLSKVRFGLLDSEFLADVVEPHEYMQSAKCRALVHDAYRLLALPPSRASGLFDLRRLPQRQPRLAYLSPTKQAKRLEPQRSSTKPNNTAMVRMTEPVVHHAPSTSSSPTNPFLDNTPPSPTASTPLSHHTASVDNNDNDVEELPSIIAPPQKIAFV